MRSSADVKPHFK